jgi:hypothetical protein
MGVEGGEARRSADGREESPMPSQSMKKQRRPVDEEDWAMDSQFRKKKLCVAGVSLAPLD